MDTSWSAADLAAVDTMHMVALPLFATACLLSFTNSDVCGSICSCGGQRQHKPTCSTACTGTGCTAGEVATDGRAGAGGASHFAPERGFCPRRTASGRPGWRRHWNWEGVSAAVDQPCTAAEWWAALPLAVSLLHSLLEERHQRLCIICWPHHNSTLKCRKYRTASLRLRHGLRTCPAEALEAADALLNDGAAADAALHIGALHAVAQHGDAATQATVRGALAADLAPLVVRLSAVICSSEVRTSGRHGDMHTQHQPAAHPGRMSSSTGCVGVQHCCIKELNHISGIRNAHVCSPLVWAHGSCGACWRQAGRMLPGWPRVQM